MRFSAEIRRKADGSFEASADSEFTGPVTVGSFSRDAALAKLRDELRFRLEACPCTTGYEGDGVTVVVAREW